MPVRNPSELPTGRLLAIDGGSTRIGLAVSDSNRRLATTVGSTPRKPWATLKTAVLQWKSQGIAAVVVGFPLNMDGTEGPACNAARSLADLIEKECALPTLLWDERLTSHQAEAAFFSQRQGRQTRGNKKESTGSIDANAATILLQAVLDTFRNTL